MPKFTTALHHQTPHIEPGRPPQGCRGRIDQEILSAVGRDRKRDLSWKLAARVICTLADIIQDATEVLADQAPVMGGPGRQVGGVEAGVDEVIQMRVEQPPVVRQRYDLRDVGVAVERGVDRARPRIIHVPEKRERLGVFGPKVNDEIVGKALAVGIDIAAECFHGKGAHPFVHIHELPGLGVECRTGQAECFGKSY